MAFYKNYLRPWFQDEFQKYISRFQNEFILQVRAKGENRKLINLSSP